MQLEEHLEAIAATAGGTMGIVARDLGSGEEASVNPQEPFYAASVIKLPIMVEVFRQAAAGRFALADRRVLRAEDQVGGSGILQDLSPGLELPVIDLVTLMITLSDNTATNMLIDLVGTDSVNETMAELGLTGSRLYNKIQVVPVKRAGTNTITAADMALLLGHIARGTAVSQRACLEMIRILKRQQDQDGIPAGLPPQPDDVVQGLGGIPRWEVANKTGWIPGIEHDAGIVYYREGGRSGAFVLVVLTRGIEDRAQSQAAIRRVAAAAYEHFALRPG